MRAIAILLGGLVAALPAGAETLATSAGPMQVQAMATGLDEPWGLAFLPDGSVLVTERDGRLLRVADGAAVAGGGVPEVAAEGQGGLLDVMLPADFATSREVWLAFSARAQARARRRQWAETSAAVSECPASASASRHGSRRSCAGICRPG